MSEDDPTSSRVADSGERVTALSSRLDFELAEDSASCDDRPSAECGPALPFGGGSMTAEQVGSESAVGHSSEFTGKCWQEFKVEFW